jgi:hypothetical protein
MGIGDDVKASRTMARVDTHLRGGGSRAGGSLGWCHVTVLAVVVTAA